MSQRDQRLTELRNQEDKELRLTCEALDKELFEMRLKAPEEIGSPARFKQIRRTVAQIETVLREREITAIREQNGGSKD